VTGIGSPLLRRVGSGAALAAIIAAAALVLRTAPTEAEWQGPIEVHGAVGEEVAGRNIAATVDGVRVARTVTASTGWIGETPGVWVVVDVSAAAVVTEAGATLATAELVLGEDTYSASTRPGIGTIADQSLSVGVPLRGPLMFEVPRDAVASDRAARAVIRLGQDGDPRTDSLLVVPLDLTRADVEDALTADEPDLVAP
jgi:hypothetical protein